MAASVDRLYALEGCQLGEDEGQEAASVEHHPAARRLGTAHDLHQFLGDALAGDDADASGIAPDGFKCLGVDVKIQLGGKTHGPHHPQRVVAEGDVRVKRRADDAAFHIADTVKGVQQFAETVLVQADGHRIDGEVAAALVVVQGAVFDNGVAALAMIGLAACPDKFQLPLARLYLCRPVGAEYRQMGAFSQATGNGASDLDTAADGHKVHVVAGTLQEDVPNVSPHNVAFAAESVGCISYQSHDG